MGIPADQWCMLMLPSPSIIALAALAAAAGIAVLILFWWCTCKDSNVAVFSTPVPEGRTGPLRVASFHLEKPHCYTTDEEYEKALESCRKQTELNPTVELCCELGTIYCDRGKTEDAGKMAAMAMRLDPAFGGSCNLWGRWLIEQGRYDDALPWLERALKTAGYEYPEQPHFNLGLIYFAKKMNDKARYHFRKAKSLCPHMTMAKNALRLIPTRPLQISILRRQSAAAVDTSIGQLQHSRRLMQEADQYAISGESDLAIELYQRSISLHLLIEACMKLALAYAKKGRSCYGKNDHSAAALWYRRACDLWPTVRPYIGLSSALMSLGRPWAAIAQCKKSIVLDPDCGVSYINIGVSLAQLRLYSKAMGWFQRALQCRCNARRDLSHADLGLLFAMKKRYREADYHFEQAAKISGEFAPSRAALLSLRKRLQSKQRAWDHFAHYNLGRAFAARGLNGKARYQFQEALKIAPNFVIAETALRQLPSDSLRGWFSFLALRC